ncbi:MAG: PilN domain-containing protein [Sarcina sp.]
MVDINFFEPYILEKQQTGGSNNVILATGCLAVAFVAGSMGYNTYTISNYNKNTIALEAQLAEPAFKEKYIEATAIAKEKQILTTYDSTLRDIYSSMKGRAMVQEALMGDVYSTVPGGVLFKTININGGKITIAGESNSENAIADLQYNLNELPFIKKSHVPSITSDLGAVEKFTFSIDCELKEEYYENK